MASEQPPDGLPGTTARMAAACQIRAMRDSEKIAAIGVRYQLMSKFTNYIAVDVKAGDKKAKDLPALRKTPQMLAAGWGGTGSVTDNMDICFSLKEPSFSRPKSPIRAAKIRVAKREFTVDDFIFIIVELLNWWAARFTERLNGIQTGLFAPLEDITSISALQSQGLPKGLIGALVELVASGVDEETSVTLFLYLLSRHQLVKNRLDRSTVRILTKAYKGLTGVSAEVQQRTQTAIDDCFKSFRF
jgi:Ca-activated chloride channel family protein